MKNLTNTILAIFSCLLLSGLVACSAGMKSAEVRSEMPPAPTKSVEAANSKQTSKQSVEMIKCGDDDKDCFIRAAKTCQPAAFTHNETADFGANIFSKTDYYEIRGGGKDECRLYTKVLKWDVTPNEKWLAEMEKRGEKPPKVDEEMKAFNDKRMKDAIGTDGVCTFTTAKLAALFERWKKGSFSTSDYKGARCQGTYFTEANGFPEGF